MNRFIKFFWILSLLGFLATLLFSFAGMSAEVDIALGSSAVSSVYLTRDVFFYLMIGIAIFTNGLLITVTRLLSLTSPVRYQEGKPLNPFGLVLTNWLGAMAAILNLFFAITALIVSFYNNPGYSKPTHYNYLIYIGLFLIIFWVVGFVWMVLTRNSSKPSEVS